MTFIMIQPVEEQDYQYGFDAGIRFRMDRMFCEPGKDYYVKAAGPVPAPNEVPTQDLFEQLQGSPFVLPTLGVMCDLLAEV